MTQWWRQILDLTYPVTSMFTGRDFNQTIKATFGETYIEDLWLPYFTVTTDITASCMRIHTHGEVLSFIFNGMNLIIFTLECFISLAFSYIIFAHFLHLFYYYYFFLKFVL